MNIIDVTYDSLGLVDCGLFGGRGGSEAPNTKNLVVLFGISSHPFIKNGQLIQFRAHLGRYTRRSVCIVIVNKLCCLGCGCGVDFLDIWRNSQRFQERGHLCHTCGCEYMVLISDRLFALVKKLWWIATNCSATILKLGSAVEDLGMNQSRIKS